jgi:CheY-like chemotaxis protein
MCSCLLPSLILAVDGDEASVPDLMLSDLNLAGFSGEGFMKVLGAAPSASEIAVVAISDNVSPAIKRRAEEIGATQYLEKPVNVTGPVA